jgi:hypothetical protein
VSARILNRKVLWNRPTGDDWKRVYVSKCGRYTIERMRMASARNGYWNAVGYRLEIVGSTKRPRMYDTFAEAKDAAEWDNDPAWEEVSK